MSHANVIATRRTAIEHRRTSASFPDARLLILHARVWKDPVRLQVRLNRFQRRHLLGGKYLTVGTGAPRDDEPQHVDAQLERGALGEVEQLDGLVRVEQDVLPDDLRVRL